VAKFLSYLVYFRGISSMLPNLRVGVLEKCRNKEGQAAVGALGIGLSSIGICMYVQPKG
jgi:hypothetical protein